MDKNIFIEQIKKIDEEIGRAIDAISEIEDIVKTSNHGMEGNISEDASISIRDKFNLLSQKLEEVTKAIVKTGIISDVDIDEEIESRH